MASTDQLVYKDSIDHQEHSFVLVGKFNTQIFHPAWLVLEGLISPEEAQESNVILNSQGATVFQTVWFKMEVTNERFKITTSQYAYFEMLRDLVIGIFEILGVTPIRALGINFSTHLKLHDEAAQEAFFQKVSPQTFWKQLMDKPVFERIQIKNLRENNEFLRIIIEPSIKIENGLFIDSNDHFDASNEKGLWTDSVGSKFEKASWVVDLINQRYNESVTRFQKTLTDLWKIK